MSKAHRRLVWLFGIILVGGLFYLLVASLPLSGNDCDPISQTNSISSPDKKLEAIVLHQACAGGFGTGREIYWIKMRRTGTGAADEGINIFEARQYVPDVAWSAPDRLIITIKFVSDISVSLHKAYEADIVYRISNDLQPVQVEKEIKEYEARTRQDLQDRKSTFTGNPKTDLQALNEAVSRWREHYAIFLRWVASNVENPPRQN